MTWTAPTTRSTGDLITASIWNTDLVADINEIWREVVYVEFTSTVSVTQTVEASATQIVSAGAATLNGNPVIVQFYCPNSAPTSSGPSGIVSLWDSSTEVGRIAHVNANAGGPIMAQVRIAAPSAGSHTYIAKAHVSAGQVDFTGGGAGVAAEMPGSIRVLQKG